MDIAGAHLGWKMLWKGGAGQLGRFVFLFTSMQACSFSPTSEFMGSSIKAKCKPMKKYKQTFEKHSSEPVKSPWGVIATWRYLQLDPIYYGGTLINLRAFFSGYVLIFSFSYV